MWYTLLNKRIFKPYFIPTSTFEELCEHNWKPGIRATQVEVVAAATIFQIPIYFISPSTTGHKWNAMHPLTNSLIHYPCYPDIDGVSLLKPSHFELLYYENLHYDQCSGGSWQWKGKHRQPNSDRINQWTDRFVWLTSQIQILVTVFVHI